MRLGTCLHRSGMRAASKANKHAYKRVGELMAPSTRGSTLVASPCPQCGAIWRTRIYFPNALTRGASHGRQDYAGA